MSAALLALLALTASSGSAFDDHFTGGTLRIDLLHRGNASGASFSVARTVAEVGWSGPRHAGLDPLGLGDARYRIVDPASSNDLYGRGYATVFLEWITTAEGKGAPRMFEESVRIPEPRRPVDLVLDVREGAVWREVFRARVDPGALSVDRSGPRKVGRVRAVGSSGDPKGRLDILLLGDGYRVGEQAKFDAVCAEARGWLLAVEPFKSRADGINFWSLHVPSPRSGISDFAEEDAVRDNVFGSHYHAFGLPRYVITYEDRRLRDAAAQVPYDAVIILLNEERYGGGGIYNLWSTCAAHNGLAPYLLVHEFGHNLAALADEYYTSAVAYEDVHPPEVEPWEPNITALHDPAKLKWKDLVKRRIPIPTPWSQDEYDAADGRTRPRLLAIERYRGKVGAFEGGGYRAKGIYRPEINCIMFSRGAPTFCAVCKRHLARVIDSYK
ncbi:MAG: peptidase M64 [Planctomycetes bacterium]|nr:peptidase M64 [Planctomycetota bacterium]